MKLYGILTAAAIILPAFASCNKEISESEPVDKIRLEPISLSTSDTKTSVNGNKIWWTLNDQIAVFSNIGNYLTPYSLSATSVEGSNAVFAGEVGEGTTDFYAIYPYSVAVSAAGGLIDITVPVDQTAKAGSFGEGMNISIAKGTKKPGIPQVAGVAFHNVCSYLKFTVPSYISNVNRVDVTCDRDIAGSTTVNYDNLESGSGVVTGPGTSKTVSMSGSFESGSTFWFVLTPGTVNSLTIKLSTGDGKNWTRTSSKSFTLKIGQPKNLGIIDFVPTLQASAAHTKDKDGYLTGTEVKVDLGLPDALVPDVSKVSLKVVSKDDKIVNDGPIVWEYTLDNVSSNSITISSDNWPYLPQGKYTVSGTYKTGERSVPFVSTEFTSPEPEFSVNTPSAYTNYNTYKTSGADAANGQDGSTIFGISHNGVKISPKILSKYASLIGEGGGYSYTIDVNSATAGDNNNQTWGEHKVFAKFTFDKVTMSSPALTCHVTGLPYTAAPPTNSGKHPWSATRSSTNVDWNGDNVQLNAARSTSGNLVALIQSPTFHLPTNINIASESTVIMRSNSSRYDTTLIMYIGGNKSFTQTCNKTSETPYNEQSEGTLTTSKPYIEFEAYRPVLPTSINNYYAKVFSVKLKYK